jgi:hypothetical protein
VTRPPALLHRQELPQDPPDARPSIYTRRSPRCATGCSLARLTLLRERSHQSRGQDTTFSSYIRRGRRVLARGATDMIAKARDYRSRSAGLCRRHAGPGVECRCRKRGAVAGGVGGTRVRTDDPEVPAAATRLVLHGGARTNPRQIVGVDAASAIRATRGPGSDDFHTWRGAIVAVPLRLRQQQWATIVPDPGDTVGHSRMRS